MVKLIKFGYTRTFERDWHRYGLTDADREDLETAIIQFHQARPENNNGRLFPGDLIKGTGGAYKYRYSSDDSHAGKSGSYRTIYFLAFEEELRFLAIYPKNKQSTLTEAEKHAIKAYIKSLRK